MANASKTMTNFNKAEILQIIDAVSREKNIPKLDLIEAMQQAIEIAGRKKYGLEQNIKAIIDQNTGKINLFRIRDVVEQVEDDICQISLEAARNIDPAATIDSEISQPLPPIDLGRVAAQIAKQVIVQKVGEIERGREYEQYKERKGDILNGIVKRIEFGHIIVDINMAEGLLHRNEQIISETFKVGDSIKAYIQDVRPEKKGAQIFLSRTDENFLRKLFETQVPEIYDHLIEIKAVAREPGSKAKIAVVSNDLSTDPVGSCVGVRGSRVGAVTNELAGEKIDIIKYDKNMAQFVINAMTPATISKIVFDEEHNRVEAIVPEDQLSMAIGKRGQNVRLASKITGWVIDVMTEEQESKRRGEEFVHVTELFMRNLDVEEVVAQLLSAEGYTTIEQIAYSDQLALENIEGFDQEIATALKERAANYIEQKNAEIIEGLEKLGVEQELLDIMNLPAEYILKLAEFGVKTVEDLAEVTPQEFRVIVPADIISSANIIELITFAQNQNKEKIEQ